MVRLSFRVGLQYEVLQPGTDFVFCIQAAHTRYQRVLSESLSVSQNVPVRSDVDTVTRSRHLYLQAGLGPLQVNYEATVELAHHVMPPHLIGEVRVADLPSHVLPYVYPSRYCESDRLHAFASAQFGALWQGYGRVQAVRDWVHSHVAFTPASSDSSTSALDTLRSGRGVCRDFAHLMIALCRSLNIPARFVTGFDYGADPALGPPDFHAYVEVYLGGRWYLFDPSGTAIPMGFVRLATGRDAADAAFGTIFGRVQAWAPFIHVEAVPDERGVLNRPCLVNDALSTDSGEP